MSMSSQAKIKQIQVMQPIKRVCRVSALSEQRASKADDKRTESSGTATEDELGSITNAVVAVDCRL